MTPGGRDIVVVDDDTSMGQAIERLLSAAGWTSRSFASAEELLASGAWSGAGVLILDIHLPGMSGFDLCRHLTTRGHLPPVIFITGNDRPNTREQARQSGVAGYFTKPFAGSELIQVIRRLLTAPADSAHFPHQSTSQNTSK